MTKRVKQKAAAMAAVLTILCNSTLIGYADGKTVTKTKTYETSDASQKASFEKEITENGITYVLDDVEYTIKEKPVMGEGEIKTKSYSQTGLSSAFYQWTPTMAITDGGKTYTGNLVQNSIKYNSEGRKSREQTVSLDKTYERCTTEPTPPDTYTYNFANPFTGSYESITMPLVSVKPTESTWVNDTTSTITFLNYSSSKYQFGDRTFYHNDDKCPLSEDLDFVREYLQYDKDTFRVVSAEWAGPADEKTNSRKATVQIERKVFDYIAQYAKEHTFYGEESFSSSATYEYNTAEGTGETINEITATARYVEKPKEESKPDSKEDASSEDVSSGEADSVFETSSSSDTSSLSSNDTSIDSVEDSDVESRDYFAPITSSSDPKDNEQEEGNIGIIMALIAGAVVAVASGTLFFITRKSIVFDENLQQLGKVRLKNPLDVTAFVEKTNRNIIIRANKKFIKNNRRDLDIRASGQSLNYSIDDKYLEITNPNNYKV